MWKRVTTQAEADSFLSAVGYFHDGCIRELHLVTNEWVDKDRSLAHEVDHDIGEGNNSLHMIVHIQWEPHAVEMIFDHVQRFNFSPSVQGNPIFTAKA